MAKLTVNDRILLHLFDYRKIRNDFPPDITQAGMASAIGIQRSHIPRSVKKLEEEEAIEEKRERIHGAGRRLKMYFLTERGYRRAAMIRRRVGRKRIRVQSSGGETELPISEASRLYEMSYSEILANLDREDVLDIQGILRKTLLEKKEFVNRQTELLRVREWLASKKPVLALYGHVGYGKTSLVRGFLEMTEGWRVFWKDLTEDDETTDVLRPLVRFVAKKRGDRARKWLEEGNIDSTISSLGKDLNDSCSLLIFDNYNIVGEDLVDAFNTLTHLLSGIQRAKMIVIAQEATPAYCRFYDRKMVERGMVDEIHLKGLSQEDSKRLLGNPRIEDEAMRRIYLLTKGNPLFLTLIREGKADELKKRSRFTTPEIQLLMFSKTVEG
ncbi:MAG: ATP-binding protein [Thermoplasmata archaeon]